MGGLVSKNQSGDAGFDRNAQLNFVVHGCSQAIAYVDLHQRAYLVEFDIMVRVRDVAKIAEAAGNVTITAEHALPHIRATGQRHRLKLRFRR